MLQRGLDYAAGTAIICAVCAALLQLAAQILSFSSPVADAAAVLGAAVLLNSLRRRMRTVAKHRPARGTQIASSDMPTIFAGVVRQESRHRECQRQRGLRLVRDHTRASRGARPGAVHSWRRNGALSSSATGSSSSSSTREDTRVSVAVPAVVPMGCARRRARHPGMTEPGENLLFEMDAWRRHAATCSHVLSAPGWW